MYSFWICQFLSTEGKQKFAISVFKDRVYDDSKTIPENDAHIILPSTYSGAFRKRMLDGQNILRHLKNKFLVIITLTQLINQCMCMPLT